MTAENLAQPSFYENLGDPDEISRHVNEAAVVLDELIDNDTEFRQALLSESVQAIIGIHNSESPLSEKSIRNIRSIVCIARYFNRDGKSYVTENGILGEVSIHLALRKLGFKVRYPTEEDDLHGAIDVWADPKDGGPEWAIQVKTDVHAVEPEFYKVEITPNRKFTRNIPEKAVDSAKNMVSYINERNSDSPAFVIVVPSGPENEDCGFNIITGAPTEKFIEVLYDKMEATMFSEEH